MIVAFALFNAILRIAITLTVVFKLLRYGHLLNQAERVGLAVAGSGSFLTLAPIWDVYREGTPYDIWAGVLLAFGFLLYMLGRLSRHIRHDRNNRAQVELSRAEILAMRKARGE